jgi:ABC-type transport system substrate-binding protein
MNLNSKISLVLATFAKSAKYIFSFVFKICKNIKMSFGLMGIFERVTLIFLLVIALLSTVYKFEKRYMDQTKVVASSGGNYREIVVGEAKTLNPILIQTDAEKSASALLFSGLIRVDGRGDILPDLAQSYEISQDGLFYTFHLRDNLLFSDETSLTSEDIVFTVSSIQAPESKSSLLKTWENIKISSPDDKTVVFELPKAYGPFIYNCNFGVLPSGLSGSDFAKKLVGSGRYAFKQAESTDGTIRKLELGANKNYYLEKSLISDIVLLFEKSKTEALRRYSENKDISALFGTRGDVGTNFDYASSKRLGLIFNLRSEKLKSKDIRKSFVEGAKTETSVRLTLLILDLEIQKQKALEIKNSLKNSNFDIEIKALDPVKFGEAVSNKSYDLVLYGFETGFDRDPYVLWHSSQLGALNLAGYSDKASDILLEDARMNSDPIIRNQKYDQFMATVANEYLAVYYEPINYEFSVKDSVKGTNKILGFQASSRYDDIVAWYIKEKRIKN